jgi:uncharacterized protein (DUF305 family)
MPRRTVPVVAVLLLTGCSATTDGPYAGRTEPPPPATVSPAPSVSVAALANSVDVMFAQMMVAHHGQGIEIARLGADRATRAEVRTLASAIVATQTTEAATMAAWLKAWNKPAVAAADEHAAHGGMPGTSRAEIDVLKKATGTDFDRRFVNMMIAHQDDAIQMARSAAASGANPQARELARRIDTSRTAQIDQLLALLGQGRTGG